MPHGSTKTGWSAGLFASVLALILQLVAQHRHRAKQN